MNFEDSILNRQKHINILDDRSDGEIGPSYVYQGVDESLGEIKPGKLSKAAASKKGGKKDPLGQTMDYEGGLNSHSKIRISQEGIENPIYDSKEDPIPKAKKIGGNGNRANVLMSGDSFGKNPLNRSSGGKEIVKNGKKGVPHRE